MEGESSIANTEFHCESGTNKDNLVDRSANEAKKEALTCSNIKIDQLTKAKYPTDTSKMYDELLAGETEEDESEIVMMLDEITSDSVRVVTDIEAADKSDLKIDSKILRKESETAEEKAKLESISSVRVVTDIEAADKSDLKIDSKILRKESETAEDKAKLESISPTGTETTYDAGEGTSKMNIKGKWIRSATAHELFYGIRPDGVVLSTCVNIQINSREEISHDKFVYSVHHFNRNVKCFCEYLTEGNGNEFWLAIQNESTCTIEQVWEPRKRSKDIVEEIINSRSIPDNTPSWQFHYQYKGKVEVALEDAIIAKYSHVYHLIFSFHTGTIDDYSCALVCNLFLNHLDCAIKNKPMSTYYNLQLYNGSRIYDHIEREKCSYRKLINKEEAEDLFALGQVCSSNFMFPSTVIKDIFPQQPRFKMRKIMLSIETTQNFFITCDDLEVSVYAYLISIFNNVILKVAQDTYFGDANLNIKILHHINTKWLSGVVNDKYIHQIGSHMIPLSQRVNIDSVENDDMLDQAIYIDNYLEDVTHRSIILSQELSRHSVIEHMGQSYKTGTWNPKYFYSICNLGNLDFIYMEHEDNSFYTFRYERAKALQDDVCMDIKFYVFKQRLNFCIDYSTEFISDAEVEDILDMLKETLCWI